MSEEDFLQSECVRWFSYQYPKLKKLLFHVPNGGKRQSKINKQGKRYSPEAKKMKLMGVVPGVSDLILLVSRKGYGSLCLEMKTKSGDQSPSQKEWMKETTAAGNKYALCRSFDEFEKTIKDYLS